VILLISSYRQLARSAKRYCF